MTTHQSTAPSPSGRARLQAFGGFLTAMVIPNMGAFIAWGLITALFIPDGWIPNESLNTLVDPLIKYMLPLLLAYSGGHLVHGQRGGVAGVIGTIGLVVGSDIPMFLGAMVMGPLSAWIIKRWDGIIQPRIRPGFEMVVNNFGLGIIGFVLCIISFKFIGPVIESLNSGLTWVINALVNTGVLPLVAVLNEPAKVLFLNNVIDQGIYYPLGMQAAQTAGKSIFFVLASNPGPGLGLLIAYWLFSGNKIMKETAPGAMIIHFLGGIHEIYFPYVLAKPITLLGMMAGAASGIATAQVFNAGLVAGPSPGSIFAYIMLTPRGNHLGIVADVVVATLVSFLVNAALLRASARKDAAIGDAEFEQARARSAAMKQEGKGLLAAVTADGTQVATKTIGKVIFACDAGMGSSTMGASLFRKRLDEAGISVEVGNTAIERVPDDADVIVTHKNLAERAANANPGVEIVSIENYLSDAHIDDLYSRIESQQEADK
ncbi:PTS mannitol transporter subunit IIBC [Actinomyces sp. Z5]|uniref:PTS system mannitol-specific EIICB component n=1 Tax=Actinomyces glycerinitolerans TaxID=1892869 RepID=A0A1M4RYL6_9ACTO|nr:MULTISPECIES: PTS mannitol transporter subunit IICB [Actinomyces]RAX21233.1 PTS mannitol transporter subunit IIBC [Actinomyces sp. Z5]SHE25085.1 phosphotransferase system eiib component type 2/3 [Actinomyces glycerinitolerans]